ncbi:MAG: zf-HC2 domain-containing protein, partial [Candidatus Latescibacterota bacterium]
ISFYQAWDEKRLNPEERRIVQQHLADCRSCRDYYDKMSALLNASDPSLLPSLEADPFLPTRIRALAEDSAAAAARTTATGAEQTAAIGGGPNDGVARATYPKVIPWLRVSLAGALTAIAVAAGIFLGKGLAATPGANSDSAIVTAYYDAVAQTGFVGDWGDVIEEEEEEQK